MSITLYNEGAPIDSFRVLDMVISIDNNTAKDVPNDVAGVMMEVYPYLKVIGSSEQTSDEKSRNDEVIEKIVGDTSKLSPREKFEQSLVKDQKYICSNCDREFETNRGYRIHLAVHG